MSKKQDNIANQHEPFVKRFKFSDGTVWESCGVKGCSYGTGRASTVTAAGFPLTTSKYVAIDDVALELDALEPEQGVEVQELLPPDTLPVAGEDAVSIVEFEDSDGNVTIEIITAEYSFDEEQTST
jgi:hypothetical protein